MGETQTVMYVGVQNPGKSLLVMVMRSGSSQPLNPRPDLTDHLTHGFAWLRGGRETTHLAVSILADYFGNSPIGDLLAVKLHRQFRWLIIDKQQSECLRLSDEAIREALAVIWKGTPELADEVDYALRELAFDALMSQEASDREEPDQPEKNLYAEYRKIADSLIRTLIL